MREQPVKQAEPAEQAVAKHVPRLPVQRKLAVGAANDAVERDADRMADMVLRSPSTEGVRTKPGRIRLNPYQALSGSPLRRVSQTIGAEGGTVDNDTASRIRSARGQPLDPNVRRSMEGAFNGADFGSVRVHTGPESTELNDRIQAKAFTSGSDIFFRDSAPDVSRASGQHLLAHELTHVVQQSGVPAAAQRVHRLWKPFKKKRKPVAVSAPTVAASTTDEDLVKMVQGADIATRGFMAKDPKFLTKVEALSPELKAVVMPLLRAALPTVVSDATPDNDTDDTDDTDELNELNDTGPGDGTEQVGQVEPVDETPSPGVDPEVQAQEQATAEAEAVAKAQAEAEVAAAQAQVEAEAAAKAKEEAEAAEAAKAKAEEEEQARLAAAAKAKEESEAKEKSEAEAKAKAEAEEQERIKEEARLQAEAAAKAKADEEAKAAAKLKADAEAEALRVAKVAKEDKKYHTTSEIEDLSLPGLLEYVDQTPTWDARSTITDPEKADIRSILSFSREPGVAATLGAYKVGALRGLTVPLIDAFSDLRCYVAAAATNDPIAIAAVDTLAKAITTGNALKRLLAGFPRWVLKTALNDNCLDILISHAWVDEVINYYKTSVPKPIFQADTGADFMSWMEARNEGWDPLTFSTGALKGKIRNFHRFTLKALERLQDNYAAGNTAQLPLMLILHAAIDHNGAFHREDAMTDAITDARNFVVMIEGGKSLGNYQSQIGPIATKFGVNGKIDQVMFAGHGNTTLIQMAGSIQDTGGKVGEVNERIDVVNEKSAADALFDEVLANMADTGEAAAQALLTPGATSYRRILFNACLTNSNVIDMALDDDNALAQAEIRDYLSKNASLATYLGAKAKKQGYDVTSLGANASIGEVDLVDSTGGLNMVSGADPKVTASKLEYAEEGIEPLGVLRAALESWAYDPAETYKAMARRVAAAVDDWDDIIICTIYKAILESEANGDSGIATTMKQWSNLASSFSEMKHDAELKVSEISGTFNISSYYAEIDRLLAELQNSSLWGSTPAIELVMLQIWMGCFPGESALHDSFISGLGAFTAKSAMVGDGKYVDVGYLESQSLLTPLLAGPPMAGKTILALIALLDGGAPASAKAYFTTRMEPGAPEIPELAEVAEVPEVKEQAAPREEVAEVPEVAGRAKVDEITPKKRPAAAEIPKLEKLEKLDAVAAPQGPVQPGKSLAPVMAPGRKGRPKRDLVPKVAAVKPYMPATLDIGILVANRATEEELIAKLK